jgi:hypothetical protein
VQGDENLEQVGEELSEAKADARIDVKEASSLGFAFAA